MAWDSHLFTSAWLSSVTLAQASYMALLWKRVSDRMEEGG